MFEYDFLISVPSQECHGFFYQNLVQLQICGKLLSDKYVLCKLKLDSERVTGTEN